MPNGPLFPPGGLPNAGNSNVPANSLNFNNQLLNSPFVQMGMQPVTTQIFGSAGFLPGQFHPTQSTFDQQRDLQFQQDQLRAMAQAGQLDQATLARALQGSMALGGAANGPQQERFRQEAARLLSMITTNAATISPDLIEQLGGQQGMAVNLARHVASGLRYTRYGSGQAGAFSSALHSSLFGGDGGQMRDLHGLGANRTGQLFDELTRRGLMPMMNDREQFLHLMNMIVDGETVGTQVSRGRSLQEIVSRNPHLQGILRNADVSSAANTIESWSGAVAAVRDLYQANGQTQISMPEVFNAIEALTNGAGGGMNPGNIEMMVRRAHQLARNIPGGLPRYLSLLRQGGQMADAMGLNRVIGSQTAASSMAFGQAFSRAGRQGIGGLSRDEATALDQQLRTAAAASPMANMLGAIMSMHADGLIRGGPAANIVTAITNRDQNAINQLSRLTPGQLRQLLQQSGVSPASTAQYLNAREANQDFIARYNLQDIVRQMQGQGEIADLMRNGLQAGMAGILREVGFNRAETGSVQQIASEAVRQALMNMDGDTISNTDPGVRAGRNRTLATAIGTAIGPDAAGRIGEDRLVAMAATAVQGLEGSMQRNPGLRRFRNVAGLVGANSGEVLSAANREVGRADAESTVASLTDGIGQSPALSRVMDAIASAGPDTNLQTIISQALGGVDQGQLASSLLPIVQDIRGNQQMASALASQLSRSNNEQERHGINASIAQTMARTRDQINAARTLVSNIDTQAAASQIQASASPSAMPSADQVGNGISGFLRNLGILRSADDFGATSLDQLQQRDQEVRLQEMMHHQAAGQYALGPPQYTYRTGPDGKSYAIGGQVSLDLSPVHGNPAATARKMAQIRAAALAPSAAGGAAGNLSADDVAVANRAAQIGQQAPMVLGSPASSWPSSLPAPQAAMIQEGSTGGSNTGNANQVLRVVGVMTIRADGTTADFEAAPNAMGAPPSVPSF